MVCRTGYIAVYRIYYRFRGHLIHFIQATAYPFILGTATTILRSYPCCRPQTQPVLKLGNCGDHPSLHTHQKNIYHLVSCVCVCVSGLCAAQRSAHLNDLIVGGGLPCFFFAGCVPFHWKCGSCRGVLVRLWVYILRRDILKLQVDSDYVHIICVSTSMRALSIWYSLYGLIAWMGVLGQRLSFTTRLFSCMVCIILP